jgi:telomere length regulation protein
LISRLLEGEETIYRILTSIWDPSVVPSTQKAIWNGFLSVTGGGRILSVSAEAEDTINELSKDIQGKYWVSDGILYSRWLAQNITHLAKTMPLDSENDWKCCVELLSKSLRLGYTGKLFDSGL